MKIGTEERKGGAAVKSGQIHRVGTQGPPEFEAGRRRRTGGRRRRRGRQQLYFKRGRVIGARNVE